MARTRIEVNDAEVGRILSGESSSMDALLLQIAEQKATAARASAPVDSGAYRDSIHAWTVQHPSRVVARYGADVDYALIVEANTGNLLRAL